MTTSRRIGASFETAVRDHLRAHGFSAHRLAQGGSRDEGDLAFVVNDREWALELKNTAKIDLAGGLKEAATEAQGRPYALIVKSRGKGVGQAYVVMTLDKWLEAIADDPPLEER